MPSISFSDAFFVLCHSGILRQIFTKNYSLCFMPENNEEQQRQSVVKQMHTGIIVTIAIKCLISFCHVFKERGFENTSRKRLSVCCVWEVTVRKLIKHFALQPVREFFFVYDREHERWFIHEKKNWTKRAAFLICCANIAELMFKLFKFRNYYSDTKPPGAALL